MISNNNINNNLAIYREEEEVHPRKFIKSNKHSKKENRLTKDTKSHKAEHKKHVAKRIQERVVIHKVYQLKTDKNENEDNKTLHFRVPETKMPKAVSSQKKRQPKINVRENLLDRLEDIEFAEQDDLWATTYEELQNDYNWAVELPKKIKLAQIKAAEREITLVEYEKKRARINAMWTEFKRYSVPRSIFDGAMEYEENQKRLEICELEPIANKKLARELNAKMSEYEETLQEYFVQRESLCV